MSWRHQLHTRAILENAKAPPAADGGTMAERVKVTGFVSDSELFDQNHEVRTRYLRHPYPASSVVEVPRLLSPEHLLDIEAVAALKQGGG